MFSIKQSKTSMHYQRSSSSIFSRASLPYIADRGVAYQSGMAVSHVEHSAFV